MGGIGPDGAKAAITRRAESGVARRIRRLVRRRKKRLQKLDRVLTELRYPLVDLETIADPHVPWKIRSALTYHFVENEDERRRAISIAVRHIARHRGWRSPYTKVESLFVEAEPSKYLEALNQRISERLGEPLPSDKTPAQLIDLFLEAEPFGKIRGEKGILAGRLHQSDYAGELCKIAKTQGIDEKELKELVRAVFAANSPRGSSKELRGKDSLPGQEQLPRAEKAHPVFQRFAMVGVLTNLRIDEGGVTRPLSVEELHSSVAFLDKNALKEPSWQDLAEHLGVERRQLKGTASASVDGMPVLARPPVNMTDVKIAQSGLPWLKQWWKAADFTMRGQLIDALSNSGGSRIDDEVDDVIVELLEQASEKDEEKLDKLGLPAGRAAYSLDSLTKLTDFMLEAGVDLHEARKFIFEVDDSWKPDAQPIGAPVGNPAVDRVTKQIARWLGGIVERYGVPESVYVEQVRAGLKSEKVVRDYMSDMKRRHEAHEESARKMLVETGLTGRYARIRFEALQRQNGQCLYCGTLITIETLEMDHIVPRAGSASTNTMNNLVAVCRTCNHSKGKIPFAVWAASGVRPEVSISEVRERVHMWNATGGLHGKTHKKLQNDVFKRLSLQEPDDELDGRSLEAVAWMARELHQRIEFYFNRKGIQVDVGVFQGALTAEARKVNGFERRIHFIGEAGKTRFDRRHHVMDALVIALMDRSVAKTLMERASMRESQRICGEYETWKEYQGANDASRQRWLWWSETMLKALELFNDALDGDRVPVMENLRLRPGNGRAHEDKISKLLKVKLGSELSVNLIDRASTPALWTALTRHPDFTEKDGLLEDSSREITVNGRKICADEEITFFKVSAASVAVRGGSAEIGKAIHHARIYRIEGKKPSYAMLRVCQVDLVKYRGEDVFTVPLAPSTVSMRYAHQNIRKALAAGTATQIGWLVEGDELRLNPANYQSGAIGEFFAEYPECTSWRVAGYNDNARIRLRPRLLSAEGLPEESSAAVKEIVDARGWVSAVNKVFASGDVELVRRNALGEIRRSSARGLPSSVRLA